MIHIFVAFCWLFISILFHIVMNKYRLFIVVPRSLLLGIFAVGFAGCAVTIFWFLPAMVAYPMSIPVTSLLLYCTCSLAYLSITASPSMGDESPTTKIVIHLLRHGARSEKQIRSLFIKDHVIEKRLRDLTETMCMAKRKDRYVITKRGKYLASVFTVYRRLLGLHEGG